MWVGWPDTPEPEIPGGGTSVAMAIDDDGTIRGHDGQPIGEHRDGVIFSGRYRGMGQQVGYIVGDVIYAGGTGTFGGRQVGYVSGDRLYTGGHGTFGGTPAGDAEYPQPRVQAAATWLLG